MFTPIGGLTKSIVGAIVTAIDDKYQSLGPSPTDDTTLIVSNIIDLIVKYVGTLLQCEHCFCIRGNTIIEISQAFCSSDEKMCNMLVFRFCK